MEDFQWRHKWIMTLSLLATVFVRLVSGCSPNSKELHICLNIYLERDFSLIETIVDGQRSQGRNGRRRVILEGPDLQNICRDIANLRDCFSKVGAECDTLWQYDRYSKMMGVLRATHDHLCKDGTNSVRDLLLNSGCLARAQTHIQNCRGFNWWMSWREVLRLQVSPSDRCVALQSYRNCLHLHLPKVDCGSEAARVYLGLIDVWLKQWCAKNSTPLEDQKYLYFVLNGT